ncbi:MAG TPA: hypothetical protein RMG95_09945, partial [Polyangiaceae bacterium LLY-WYZ-15_(1-7)]|nr:hypothetical protein [Polyangiaceae bacterium LLY-WYZ-15_(1-7)]
VVDTEGAAPASLSAHARLRLGVDRRTSLVTLGAGELQLAQGVDGGDVSVAGANLCGRVWCSAARLANVGERIATRIDDALEAQARARLDALTCRPCAAGCEPGSACVEGVCRRAPPNAEAPGACDPRPLGAAFEVGPDRSLGLTFALADEARAHRGGLDVAVRLGARPRVDALCVPDAPAPPPTPLPAAILERGSDAGAHVRVALGESALARAFWAAWRAGLGCAELGGEGSPVPLDLARLLPSSQSLAFLGVDAPRLRVRPTRAPEVRVEEDGAVAWAVPGLGLELEAEVDGRRLVLARATLRLAGVARLGVGEEGLWLGLEGTEAEVERIAAAPLLADDPETLAPTFDVLARLAVAAAPARVELGALPGPLRLVEPPRRVSHEDVRALALRLRVEAP